MEGDIPQGTDVLVSYDPRPYCLLFPSTRGCQHEEPIGEHVHTSSVASTLCTERHAIYGSTLTACSMPAPLVHAAGDLY